MAKKVDSKVLELMNEVKKRKAEIIQAERPQYKTNCAFSYEEGSSKTVNLQVESNIGNLIKIAAFLKNAHDSYYTVRSELKLSDSPDIANFTWNGFTLGYWLDDINTRIAKLSMTSKKNKLEAIENRLNLVISPELRAQMEIDAISSELS